MYDGSIVKFSGELYKKIMGDWVLLSPDPSVWYTDEWMMSYGFEVVAEAGPLEGVAEGTVVACADGSIVAVYQGYDGWTISGYDTEFMTNEMLEELGKDWKIVYRPGENNE